MQRGTGLKNALIISMVILLALFAGFLWYTFKFRSLYGVVSPVFLTLAVLYTLLILVYLPIRIILYTLYKPYEDRGYRPSVTVVVPAYNEGKFIERTIDALVQSDYPRDKLEIVVVDDGSKDETYKHILNASSRHPGWIRSIRFDRNRGKREAMAEGVSKAKGEIIVFIDSDTRVDKDSIKHLVAPFERPIVGGVTGKVKVHNWKTNFLTRMMAVRYIMSFDFYRSTSSVFGGISCLSGVISAYRKEILDRVIPAWRDQHFLGRKCTFGDDRSLTNHTLRLGYHTVYSRKAVAHTLVPESFGKMARMLIRWNRSFTRESIILFGYLLKWKVIKKRKLLFYESVGNVVLPFLMMLILLTLYVKVIMDPFYLLTVTASVIGMSMIYMLFYIRSERNWQFVFGIAYAFFYMSVLIWLLPYAMMTVGRTGWGTR
ncbi:MAG: glycosyltransferase [Candidatus Thermoplasmatota archaeon]|nr:glycosyltransferase [Candidatus Thermoplasmatota archaeon]